MHVCFLSAGLANRASIADSPGDQAGRLGQQPSGGAAAGGGGPAHPH